MNGAQPGNQRYRGYRVAFTLIELLICIAIAAVVLGVLLPALASAKRGAQTTTCVASIRAAVFEITGFADAHDGFVPSVPRWEDQNYEGHLVPQGRLDFPDGSFLQTAYFPAGRWWAAALRREGPLTSAWTCPAFDPADHLRTRYFYGDRRIFYAMGQPLPLSSYEMSEAFRADPGYWRSGRMRTLADLSPQRLYRVSFPSRKVLLYERVVLHEDTPPRAFWESTGPVAMADGSAGTRNAADALPGVRNILESPQWETRLRNTREGILGIDF